MTVHRIYCLFRSQPHIMPSKGLKLFTRRSQWSSVTEIPWVMRMANQLLGKPFRTELAASTKTTTMQSFTRTFLGAPSCDSLTSFPEKALESIWCEQEHGPISSLPELKVSFPHVSWCVLETLFEAKRTIDRAVTALTSFQVPSSTILAHAIPWAHSTHSKRACHQRSHPWSEDMSSKKDDD